MEFFLWNESIKSFIPMIRINLWCPIIKRKEIIMWIYDYCNWKTNINSKFGRKRSFSFETKASISFIPIKRICFWCPIMKKKRLLHKSLFIPIDRRTLILEMVRSKVFLMKLRHQLIYPSKENAFMVSNQEKKGDYYENLCLPHSIDKFWF